MNKMLSYILVFLVVVVSVNAYANSSTKIPEIYFHLIEDGTNETALTVDSVEFIINNNRTVTARVRTNNVQYNGTSNYTILADTWYRARIEIISGSQANFYLYNSTTTTGAGNTNLIWSTNVTGILPTGSSRYLGHTVCAYKNGGTVAQDLLQVDYMNLKIDRLINR